MSVEVVLPEPGPVGLSAYEIAVANGFVGTEAEWLESLKGDPGSPGPAGPASAYTHVQGSTSTVWVINHNLGYVPAITVVDSGGTAVFGEVNHVSNTQAIVKFATAFSGTAYAS